MLTNEEVARGIFLMRLYAPEIAATALPGQFVNVKVSSDQQRGDAHLQLFTGFPLLRRPFSVCQVDRRTGAVSLLWKLVGRGTSLLARYQPGAILSVIGPLGHGFELPDKTGPIALVAGGVGVASFPLLAMELTSRNFKFDVLLGAQTADALWGEQELSQLGGTVQLATDDGSLGEKGFVTQLLEKWLQEHAHSSAHVFACGPMPMLATVAQLCKNAGVKAQVSIETMMGCGFGICMGCPIEPAAGAQETGHYYLACLDGPVFMAEAIRLARQ
ncbi:MAG: dihydroorotate dehydrogenase electron transfer subunit [candidate division KSB1 bacterium]|nr:dihydroorotate dehydrogenase electron transfer subunit [candidate division KSB1 bacterium]